MITLLVSKQAATKARVNAHEKSGNTDTELRSLLWLILGLSDLSRCQCCLQMKGQVIADVTFRHGKRAPRACGPVCRG